MKIFAALLRGINVGGTKRIAMGELRSSFSSLGLENVVTYIQSGNVVFRSPGSVADLAGDIERRIAKDFAMNVTVLLRTSPELEAVARDNPYLKSEADVSKLHVVFLRGRPSANAVADLDPERSPRDEFTVRGREIYLHLPYGSGRSKLTIDYFERRLGVAATARNWNTLLKLIALTQS